MPNAKIQDQVEALAREFAARVTRLVAQSIAEEVEVALSRHVRPSAAASEPAPAPARASRAPRGGAAASRRRAGTVERWVPDRNARRVPNFVIEATGLKTKQEIVTRYGEHAIFEKGQPAPAALRTGAAND